MNRPSGTPGTAFGALRRFTERASAQRVSVERCDVCGAELPDEHAHLFEPAARQLLCACDPCLVSVGNREGTPYRRVGNQVRLLPGFQMTDAQWDGLLIPVGIAFFFHSSPVARVMALYPSPAGATESLLGLDTWDEIVRDNPVLGGLEPDVEALLVNRLGGASEYFLVPIDKCYELVGLIRGNWRGFGGGSEVWQAIGAFWEKLRRQASRP